MYGESIHVLWRWLVRKRSRQEICALCLRKFGPDTWLMSWQAQGRRLLTEIDAWGNFIGDIYDVTDDINWGVSRTQEHR